MTNPNVAAGLAAANALAPLAGADGVIAMTLINQGFAYWTERARQLAAGALTKDDLTTMAAAVNADLAELAANVAKMPDDPV